MKIRKNDTVLVVAGKDKGKKGKVRRTFPNEDKIIVEGINMIKRHSRARRAARQAGIIEREAPIHVSNVMLLCTKCSQLTRVGFRFLENGKKARICQACSEIID